MMFGAAAPMWTALPSAGGSYQSSSPMMSAPGYAAGGMTTTVGAGSMPGPMLAASGSMPGSSAGYPAAQQTAAGVGLVTAYPLAAANPMTMTLPESAGLVSAATLLATVAMRRGQPQGPASDAEIEEFTYDALELIPSASDVEVRCENGKVTLTGSVPHKRAKRDVGEIVWAIPAVQDVQNNVSIASRRRARSAGRESEATAGASPRKG